MKDYKNDVYNRFYKDVFPKLKEFEHQRIAEFVKMCVLELPVIFVCILCIYNYSTVLNWWKEGNTIVFLIKSIVLLIPAVLSFNIPLFINGHFQEKLKDKLMYEVVKCFPDLTDGRGYFEGELSWDILERSKLFNFDSYHSEIKDTFHGSYNGTEFDIAEVKLCEERRTSKGAAVVTTFKGVIISFDCNKEIKAHTLITSKSKNQRDLILIIVMIAGLPLLITGDFTFFLIKSMFKYDFLKHESVIMSFLWSGLWEILFTGGMILLFWWLINRRKLSQEVKLESNEFNKRYKVESEDQVEARYLITPSFMERFMNLTTEFGTKDIQCAFFGSRILFAISTNKNLFELGSIYKPLTNPQNVKLFDEIISIIDMIDHFKLDKKTGL